MGEEQPTFKVVDRRPFNPDGTPRELSPEEQQEAERVAESLKIPTVENTSAASAAATEEPATHRHPPPEPLPPEAQTKTRSSGDPLDDPTRFVSLIMSLASNAAASLGLMPQRGTGGTGRVLRGASHW